LKCYTDKAGATAKSVIPNAGNAFPYDYAGKARTEKSPMPNTGNAVRYGYASKTFAIDKSCHTNAGNIVEIAINNSC
jgi:hypothetical protein